MKDKIVICFFGVIARSIRYTHSNLKMMLINAARKDYDVDVYVFNNNIEDTPIDSTIVDNDDKILLRADYVEEEKQVLIDENIDNFIKTKNITCIMRGDYSPPIVRNAIRQMYSEDKVGDFLERNKDKYKCAIVCGPDYFLLNKVNLADVQSSIELPVVYTADVNNGGTWINGVRYSGYTNGFYIGAPHLLIKILKRYSMLDRLLPTKCDYESLLKLVFHANKIQHRFTDSKFFKVRSNRDVDRQGVMEHNDYTEAFHIVSNYVRNCKGPKGYQ